MFKILILLLNIIFIVQPAESKGVIVYGYLPSWKDPGGGTLDSIDWDALTHIIEAFGIPRTNAGQIGTIYTEGLRKGTLTAKAHENYTRCHISLGGWGGSDGFKDAVQPAIVDKFVTNIYNLVVANGYDGVDIDWEFPDRNHWSAGLPNGSDLFNIFMEKLYNKFKDPASAKTFDNNPLEVTFAYGSYYVSEIDWANISQYCDNTFMMGYDFSNPWNGPLRNSSGAWNSAGPVMEGSVHGAIEYIVSQGFPREKVILGLPFYATSVTTNLRLNYSFVQTGITGGWIDYLGFDTSPGPFPGPAEARVEYGPDIYYFNDTNSFIHKISYATNHNQVGIGIWEISQCGTNNDLWNVIKRYIVKPFTIEDIAINPSIITNEQDNTVTFLLKAVSFLGSISNITIDLSSVGGNTNAIMTNISDDLYRHTYLVTNYTGKGTKNISIRMINTIGQVTNIQANIEVKSISVVSQGMAVPNTITNDRIKNIIFTVKVKSRWAEIDKVTIDLSPIGGITNVIMTDTPGMTNFSCQYSNAIGINAGPKELIVTATDKSNNAGSGIISLNIIDKYPPEPPKNIKARSDRNHIILNWSPGVDETGILGYKICRGKKKGHYDVISFIDNRTNWEDTSAEIGKDNYYAIITVDTSGNESEHSREVSALPFIIKDGGVILEDNYFTGEDEIDTSFNFSLKKAGTVTIKLYSIDGMLIDTIVDERMDAGDKRIYWRMPGEQRNLLGSSIYFVHVITPEFRKIVKVVIFKK